MENNLPSILGGMAQGFTDFGKGLFDMFGTGGAAIGDLIEGARTGKVTTKNQDDFRKWLYQTDSTKDAAAKGLGTALNGVQTVLDYIPGVNVLTRNPLGNAAQGALGGLADEFKTYGENYDLGRAGQRAAVSGAAAAASGSLADALKGSSNALLSSNTLQGLARGATGGAITGGGYAAIDGGDVLEAAKQGAGMGALIGGATGLAQDFKPAKTYDVALTDDERAARIANAQKQIDDIGPVPMFTDDPDNIAKRARISELRDSIKAYQAGYDTTQDYKDAMAARRANRKPYTPPEAQYQPKIGEDVALGATEVPEGYTRLYRGLETEFDPKYVPQVSDNGYGYESWSDSYDLAREYAGPDGNIYSVDVPNARIADQIVTPDGERMPVVRTDKKAGLKSFSDENKFIDGKEYLLNVNDPLRQELTYSRVTPANTLENAPSENMKLYRGISAPDDATLQRYIDEMKDPNIAPTTHSGGSAYGQGYYFTPDEGLARYYANESGLPSTAIMEIEVPRNRFTEISKENGNRPADFDLAAVKRGVPEDIRYETGLKDFNDYLDNNGYWGSKTSGENPTYTIMRNDAVLNAKRIDAPSLETILSDADMAVNNPKLTPEQEAYFKDSVIRDENGNLMPMYHGTRGNFTVFGDNAPSDTSNSHASVGNWFTPTKEGAKNFAESIWYGDGEPTVMETYLNVKNPKVYETVDNSKAVEALTKELREMELNSNKLSDTELYSKNIYDASMAQRMLEQEGKDTTVKWLSGKGYGDEKAAKLVDEIAGLNEQAAKKKALLDKLSELKYSDAYQRFKTDIYKMDGQTAEDANVGGTGMALNDRGSIKKYVDKLKSEGYDGIIIKGTRYDADTMGGPNDQYVVFDSNQIKNTNNLRPTENPDIMMSKLAPGEADLARALANQDLSINNAKVAPGQLGLFDDMPTQTPKTGTRQTSLFDQPDNPYLDYYGADIDAAPIAPETPGISGPVDMSVEDLTKIAIDESTLPKGWKKAQELANMGKRAKQIVLDPNDPNRAQNEYNVALYSDAQYGRNMPVADVIDRLGQIQYGREVDRGAARLLADQLDESGDEFAKKFVTGAAEAGGNISHYRDAPKAKLADEQLSSLLNIGRSNSMLSDSLANPSSRNARGDQWKGTINLDGKSITKGSDGGISTFGHERLHAFQDAGNMGYDQRVVDAYNELHDDLSKIYHSDSQIRKDYGSDVKYWSKPIEQEARMAQFYLEDKFGVKGAQRVPERDANGKAIRYKDDGTIADPNNLRDYYTGKPAYKGEFEGDREAINAAFDKFRGKLQDLTRKGVALPAFLTLLGGGAYMASQENDKEKEVK